ncbi:MAG: DUF4886 domain-containing protein [Eubacteriales bacterium]|nr:DUF4886 domain-containing protein [Eubacteriales bacterium]
MKEILRILAVGNSFSQDAQYYLHDLAKSDGAEIYAVNLYIGGCSLETHHINMLTRSNAYSLEINGKDTGKMISLEEAMLSEDWDHITFQQASHDSGSPETYFPFLSDLYRSAQDLCPRSVKHLHQTWAYEHTSDHPAFGRYGFDQTIMYNRLKAAYDSASLKTGMSLIPSGYLIQKLREHPEFDFNSGGRSLCRDGYHLDLLYGRFAVSALWYKYFTGNDIRSVTFTPAVNGISADERLLEIIRNTIHTL